MVLARWVWYLSPTSSPVWGISGGYICGMGGGVMVLYYRLQGGGDRLSVPSGSRVPARLCATVTHNPCPIPLVRSTVLFLGLVSRVSFQRTRGSGAPEISSSAAYIYRPFIERWFSLRKSCTVWIAGFAGSKYFGCSHCRQRRPVTGGRCIVFSSESSR